MHKVAFATASGALIRCIPVFCLTFFFIPRTHQFNRCAQLGCPRRISIPADVDGNIADILHARRRIISTTISTNDRYKSMFDRYVHASLTLITVKLLVEVHRSRCCLRLLTKPAICQIQRLQKRVGGPNIFGSSPIARPTPFYYPRSDSIAKVVLFSVESACVCLFFSVR